MSSRRTIGVRVATNLSTAPGSTEAAADVGDGFADVGADLAGGLPKESSVPSMVPAFSIRSRSAVTHAARASGAECLGAHSTTAR